MARLVEVTRGGIVESVHAGVVVVSRPEGTVCSAGERRLVTFPRSSLKPFQALALVAAGGSERFGLTEEELAVICASHAGEERHLAAVAGILEKIGAPPEALGCGTARPNRLPGAPPSDQPPRALAHTCSGKHAGMLALARLLGAPLDGYLHPQHPAQRAIRRALEEMFGADAIRGVATDGCNAPAYALPVETVARAFGQLARPTGPFAEALARIGAAMRCHPELVGGSRGFLDSALMAAVPGLVAKRGAEGFFALGLADGTGLALKVRDGDPAGRAVGPATMGALIALGVLDAGALPPSLAAFGPLHRLYDRDGAPVGAIQPARALRALGRG
ncbi:MAG: asparaginase [Chloroflexota bacterium]|nr:asparaginase [Dehalococcoidia bacterium]MDW8252256.1 asparaginase [Chloroflexota bacterium]